MIAIKYVLPYLPIIVIQLTSLQRASPKIHLYANYLDQLTSLYSFILIVAAFLISTKIERGQCFCFTYASVNFQQKERKLNFDVPSVINLAFSGTSSCWMRKTKKTFVMYLKSKVVWISNKKLFGWTWKTAKNKIIRAIAIIAVRGFGSYPATLK